MRKQRMFQLLAFSAGLGLVTAGDRTEAGIQIYTDPTEFRRALGPVYVEELDSIATLQPPLANPIPFGNGSLGFTVSGDYGGMRRTSIAGDLGLAALTGTDVLVVDRFTGPVQGVGGWFSVVTYGLDTLDRDGTFRVTVTDGLTTVVHEVDRPDGFVGFLSDAALLRSLTVARSSGPGTGLANLSSVTLGARLASVPEPSSLAALVAGAVASLVRLGRHAGNRPGSHHG